MEPRLSMVTLGVSDLDRATAFYRDGLGLPTSGDAPGVTFFALKGAWLALYPRENMAADAGMSAEGQGFGGITLAHNVHSKEEVDAVLQQAQTAGATITKPGHDMSWGGYAGYFTDMDGFLWEVAWNPDMDLT
jgi:catechol 2,3-dioxygenase-like lactoylglutathione lyase family enzyme